MDPRQPFKGPRPPEPGRPGTPGYSPRKLHGRRKGAGLTAAQEARTRAGLTRHALDLTQPCPADPRALVEPAVARLRLEVGFGGGEHLAHELARCPEAGFIGCEPFLNGITSVLSLVEDRPEAARLRLHMADAGEVLDWLPAGSLARADVLYPDPWPKLRHHKRRFIRPDNLTRLARALAPGAELRVASDIPDYINWTREHATANEAFEPAYDSPEPWTHWPSTRYEAKALREGRQPHYLIYRRR